MSVAFLQLTFYFAYIVLVKIMLIEISNIIWVITAFLILRAFGLTNIDTIRNIISNSKYAPLVFVLLELVLFVFFCFVPIMEAGMITLGMILFGAWEGFLLSSFSCIVSSCILFVIGDKFGEGMARKLIGKSELERAQDIVTHKSKFMLPIFFFIPGFPDDAICLVAGMTKMKFLYFFIVTTICHLLDVAIICFLGEFINWSMLTPIDWVLLINVLIIDFYLLIKMQRYLERTNKNKKEPPEKS